MANSDGPGGRRDIFQDVKKEARTGLDQAKLNTLLIETMQSLNRAFDNLHSIVLLQERDLMACHAEIEALRAEIKQDLKNIVN